MTVNVNSLTGPSQNPVTQASKTAGKQSLTQADFLTLITTQLKNQDPTAPVDNTQLVSQLAQLSTVDGINTLNTTVGGIGTQLSGNTAASAVTNATALIGHPVLVPGGTATPVADGSVTGAVNVASAATDVIVTIKDMTGTALRTLDLGAQPQGQAGFRWDGTDASGAPTHAARVQLSAYTVNGTQRTAATTDLVGTVSAVDLSNASAPMLVVPGLGSVPVSAVSRIGG